MVCCSQFVKSKLYIILATAWVVWGFPWDHLTNNSIYATQFWDWKLHLVTRDVKPCLIFFFLWFHLDLHICIHFRKLLLYCVSFLYYLQMTLNFSSLSLYSHIIPSSLLNPTWSSHFRTPIAIDSREIYLSPDPVSYPIPNLCGSMVCNLVTIDLTANIHI